MLPEAVNEFAYPPRYWCALLCLGKKNRKPSFSLSSTHNTVSDCNGCKSIHTKVKQFVLPKLPLCLCTKLYQMISYAKAPSHYLQNPVVSSAAFVCLEIYWIEDIFSFRNIFHTKTEQSWGSSKSCSAHLFVDCRMWLHA